MLKPTKKLTLNKTKLRVLLDNDLDRVAGGQVRNTNGSSWCSTDMRKCCSTTVVSK